MASCRDLVAPVAPVVAAVLLVIAPVIAPVPAAPLLRGRVLAGDTLPKRLCSDTHERSPSTTTPDNLCRLEILCPARDRLPSANRVIDMGDSRSGTVVAAKQEPHALAGWRRRTTGGYARGRLSNASRSAMTRCT